VIGISVSKEPEEGMECCQSGIACGDTTMSFFFQPIKEFEYPFPGDIPKVQTIGFDAMNIPHEGK